MKRPSRTYSPLLLSAVSSLALCACNGEFSGGTGFTPSGGGVRNDPGRVTLHRLNRVEYNNTVHDLLGTALHPADDFPTDDRGYGFDNIADVLSLSPLQIELYQRAAEILVNEALAVPSASQTLRLDATMVKATVGAAYNKYWNLFSNGEVSAQVTFPADGDYTIAVRAFGQQAGPDPARMQILVDHVALQTFDVTAVENAPAVYTVKTTVKKGLHPVAAAFINDFYIAMPPQDRNLIFDYMEITGPLNAMAPSNPLRDRIMTCDPKVAGADPCARKILGAFASRAFRRPVTDDEVTRLMAFMAESQTEGGDFDQGIRLALQAILISPHFVFRVETDPSPTSTDVHALGDFELASRLSYFLWSSMPDDALLAAAAKGDLKDPDKRKAHIVRMLADPRADALVENFAGQWLETRGLDDHFVDYNTYPSWNTDLKLAMRTETQLFFREFLFHDLGMDKLLTADFTFVNALLAKHYGLDFNSAMGPGFQRVALPGERRGVLGQASVLTVTSYPGRTSPVKRGKWVLEQLLCAGPPPPPPNVMGLMPEKMPVGTLRQLLEAHRANPNCAGCHTIMDPIGFGLEHFDGVGAYRTMDSGFPIDSTGQLAGSTVKFDGALQLAQLLNQDDRYGRCVAQQLYVYALGRGPAYDDNIYLDRIRNDFVTGGYRLKDLIVAIVESDAFRMRRGEPDSPAQGGGK